MKAKTSPMGSIKKHLQSIVLNFATAWDNGIQLEQIRVVCLFVCLFFNVSPEIEETILKVCVKQNFFLNSQRKSERKRTKHHTYRFQTILQIHSEKKVVLVQK